MSIAWNTAEDAIRAWVKTGSALADGKLIFAHQNAKAPNGTFITIKVGDMIALGVDGVEALTDLGRPAGQEIEHRTFGLREFSVSVQAFSDTTTGASTARALLSKVQAALALPSVVDALAAAGLSCFDSGRVQLLNAVDETRFEGRALLEVRFYANETVSEFVGYIKDVEVTDLATGRTFTITSP